jgi:hypothetical protein
MSDTEEKTEVNPEQAKAQPEKRVEAKPLEGNCRNY